MLNSYSLLFVSHFLQFDLLKCDCIPLGRNSTFVTYGQGHIFKQFHQCTALK